MPLDDGRLVDIRWLNTVREERGRVDTGQLLRRVETDDPEGPDQAVVHDHVAVAADLHAHGILGDGDRAALALHDQAVRGTDRPFLIRQEMAGTGKARGPGFRVGEDKKALAVQGHIQRTTRLLEAALLLVHPVPELTRTVRRLLLVEPFGQHLDKRAVLPEADRAGVGEVVRDPLHLADVRCHGLIAVFESEQHGDDRCVGVAWRGDVQKTCHAGMGGSASHTGPIGAGMRV